MTMIKKLLTTTAVLGAVGTAVFGGAATASASTAEPSEGAVEQGSRHVIDDADGLCIVLNPDGSVAISLEPCDDGEWGIHGGK